MTPSAPGLADVLARISAIEARFGPFAAVTVPGAGASASFASTLADVTTRVGQGDPVPAPAPRSTAPSSSPAAPGAPGTADPAQPSSGSAWTANLPDAADRWVGAIEAAADRNGLDPRLFASLVWAESGFRQDVRSHAGAVGLSQLMPATAAELGVDPYDPVQNLDGGARYLKRQLDRFGEPSLALAAYNAGPGRVSRAGGIPDISETRTYVQRVLDYRNRLG